MRQLLRFWRVLAEEGLYGALDWLAFTYIDDRYVPHRWWTGCFYPNGCGRFGHDMRVQFDVSPVQKGERAA